jgi:hypothetical protein
MKPQGLIRWAGFILLAYGVIGGVYYFAGYLQNILIGKQNVFSPLIGLPLTMLGWPQMVYADLVHLPSQGLKISTVLALVFCLFLIPGFLKFVSGRKANLATYSLFLDLQVQPISLFP